MSSVTTNVPAVNVTSSSGASVPVKGGCGGPRSLNSTERKVCYVAAAALLSLVTVALTIASFGIAPVALHIVAAIGGAAFYLGAAKVGPLFRKEVASQSPLPVKDNLEGKKKETTLEEFRAGLIGISGKFDLPPK